ncbi:hypothetical protein OG216_46995 (plasmid) [Streptomycetaceae bacterium NBC_01309]
MAGDVRVYADNIDLWHAEHNEHDRKSVRAFLLWSQSTKISRRFRLPAAQIQRAAPLAQRERLDMLGRVLADETPPLRSRVAALIVLLYAQPLSRVVRLTVDDVIHDDRQVLLRLGDPPTPVPTAVAELLLHWIANRDNMNTATNRDSRWLFPGRRAGQPMHPDALSAQVNELGVPAVASRVAAIRQHVRELPAPVVADALGYHHKTTTRLQTDTGTSWSRYAPGDHSGRTAEAVRSNPGPATDIRSRRCPRPDPPM